MLLRSKDPVVQLRFMVGEANRIAGILMQEGYAVDAIKQHRRMKTMLKNIKDMQQQYGIVRLTKYIWERN